MQLITDLENQYKKSKVVDVKSGDTVRVHQKIREGNKERIQIFQGLVIRVDRRKSHTERITVRKVASGVGVEKSFLLNSPLITKVEVTKRSKVRRNYLSYMRNLTGKASRLTGIEFDKEAVNAIPELQVEEAKDEVKADVDANKPEDPKTESKQVA